NESEQQVNRHAGCPRGFQRPTCSGSCSMPTCARAGSPDGFAVPTVCRAPRLAAPRVFRSRSRQPSAHVTRPAALCRSAAGFRFHDSLKTMDRTTVFTDGAAKGNPGPGGWGAIVITPSDFVTELGGGSPHTTNNKMELSGAI